MIADIESGKINCVITKDLSRLGRNYLETGVFIEVYFPEHNVRYIAINDVVDTSRQESADFTPFRNIINELYAKDTSKKVRSAKREGCLMECTLQPARHMATKKMSMTDTVL